jgi:hypothetical protein
MDHIDRRQFLRTAVLGAAAAGVGLAIPRPLRADGALLKSPGVLALGGGAGPRILEIYCHGGMCQWENFWLRPDLADQHKWGEYTELEWACAGSPMPDAVTEFGDDALGQAVYWGPATAPLWTSKILNRTRMVTVSHGFDPHEIALSQAITGRASAGPKRAGLGAAIQAHWMAQSPRALPYSYVLSSDDIGHFSYAASYATSTGAHGGAARPLHIKVGSTALKEQLLRSGITPSSNALLDYYRNQFRARMRFQGSGKPVRSAGYEAYENAAGALGIAPQLDGLLSQSLLEVEAEEICVPPSAPLETFPNSTRTSLRLAAHLLEAGDARHACVFDRGVLRAPGGVGAGYDAHTGEALPVTATNVFNLCREIRALVDAQSGPRIDLNQTLIVIQTEFSRTAPGADSEATGTNHFPAGMVSILIGAGIGQRAISGALGDAYVCENEFRYSHTDVHGALIDLAGASAIGDANFSESEFSEPVREGNAADTLDNIRQVVLGH